MTDAVSRAFQQLSRALDAARSALQCEAGRALLDEVAGAVADQVADARVEPSSATELIARARGRVRR